MIEIHAGRYSLLERGKYSKECSIDSIIVHEKYQHKEELHDIALLKLADILDFNPSVQPVCLQGNHNQVVGDKGTVVGWGYNENNTLINILSYVTVPLVDNDKCAENIPVFMKHLQDTMFCAGDRNSSSPCPGDSGGGLYFNINEKWVIRGIVAIGKANPKNLLFCNPEDFVVYTDVTKYFYWIQKHMKISVKFYNI